MIAADKSSYFNASPGFTPVVPGFHMGNLLQMSGAV